MTTPEPDGSLTAADLLFGSSADAPKALTRHIMSAGNALSFGNAVKHLPRVTREAAAREAANAAAGLLKVDLMEVLVAGWRDHREIISAAKRTLATPASKELVGVAPHRISTIQQPAVSILIDGRRVHTLQLGLSIVLDVTGLVAGIHVGRLDRIHAGRCAIGVALTVHEIEVLTKRAHHVELPGVRSLKSGLRLLPASEYPDGGHTDGLHAGGFPSGGLLMDGAHVAHAAHEAHEAHLSHAQTATQFPSVELAGHPSGGALGGQHPSSQHPGPEHVSLGFPGGEHEGTQVSGSSHPGSEHPEDHPDNEAAASWWEKAERDRPAEARPRHNRE